MMPKERTVEGAKKEHEAKEQTLEERIEERKKERDAKRAKEERRFRKDSSTTLKWLVGDQHYRWLCEWMKKNKEREIEEAKKKHEWKRKEELEKMSIEDYLFHYFSDPQLKQRLKKDRKHSKPEEIERLSVILVKLQEENLRLIWTRA